MKQTHIGRALGLSKGQISKLVQRGMPTSSLEAAEAWRRNNLDPGKVVGHRLIRKPDAVRRVRRDQADDAANPIDRVAFCVLPHVLFDRARLLLALVDTGLNLSGREVDLVAWAVADRLHACLVDDLGFPARPLNLPDWMDDVDLGDAASES